MKDDDKNKIELAGFLSNEFTEDEAAEFEEEYDEYSDEIDDELFDALKDVFKDPSALDGIIGKLADGLKIPKDMLMPTENDIEEVFKHLSGNGGKSFNIPGIGEVFFGSIPISGSLANSKDEPGESEEEGFKISDMFPTPSTFAKIPAFPTRNIGKKFLKVAGKSMEEWTQAIKNGNIKYVATYVTERLNLDDLDDPELEYQNKRCAIFYANQKGNSLPGVYLAVVADPDENFTLFIPEFGNTFHTGAEIEETRFLNESDPISAIMDPNQEETREQHIVSGIQFMTVLQENSVPFMTPRDFGTFRKVKPPISGSSNIMQLGTLISNNSQKSKDLVSSESIMGNSVDGEYPLYAHFISEDGKPVVYSEDELKNISERLFKVNYEESKLLDVSELYTGAGTLYINIII